MKMDKRQNLELIADISNANGAPGFEDDVVAQIRRHAEGLGELREDSLRNFYIYRKLEKMGVKLSVLARGVSIGDELEYTDEITLGRSIVNRTTFTGTV